MSPTTSQKRRRKKSKSGRAGTSASVYAAPEDKSYSMGSDGPLAADDLSETEEDPQAVGDVSMDSDTNDQGPDASMADAPSAVLNWAEEVEGSEATAKCPAQNQPPDKGEEGNRYSRSGRKLLPVNRYL
jgi:hypothetical protein